jgi:endonuclease III
LAATGFPGPIKSKTLAVPANQGIRFEDLQCLQATGPQAVERDLEQPLTPVKTESLAWCLVYHGQLLAKRQNFEVQEGAISEQSE